MSRIPNEGLKPYGYQDFGLEVGGLNEQNPERGIETPYTS